MAKSHFHHFNQSLTKYSRDNCFKNLLWMHCNKLNRDACVETLKYWMILVWWFSQDSSNYQGVKQMNLKLRSDEGGICTESSLVWNQLITSSCFELYMWCPEISLSKSLCNWGTSSVSYKNVEICIALFHTYQNFSVFTLQFANTQHYFSIWLTSAWVICMSQWYLD